MVEQLHSLADRVSDFAREVGLIGSRHLARDGSVQEPCVSCGEETAVGSIFYSDRLSIPGDGRPDGFLCALCAARIRASHRDPGMSAEDLAAFTRNASAAAISWFRNV
jgi:hypothetical protein